MLDSMFYLFIQPLIYLISLFVEVFFPILSINSFVGIVLVSIFIQIICTPIYQTAQKFIEKDNIKKAQMKWRIDTIIKHFSGQERRMLLNTYYRQNQFNPLLSGFKNSFIILIQVPFFLAAYYVFSRAGTLFQSPVFNQINESLSIFDVSINVWPVLMTLVNIVSVFVFLKNSTIITQLKACLLPIVFLVLLYQAPSEIVIYWLLNNIYSLLRNIRLYLNRYYKVSFLTFIMAGIGLALCVNDTTASVTLIVVLIGLGLLCYGIKKMFLLQKTSNVTIRICIGWGLLLMALYHQSILPLFFLFILFQLIRIGYVIFQKYKIPTYSVKTVLCIGLMISCLLGFVIPVTVMASSVVDFLVYAPIMTIIRLHFLTCIGCFVLIPLCIFYLLSSHQRPLFCFSLGVLLCFIIINWLSFNPPTGNVSVFMIFSLFFKFPVTYMLLIKGVLLGIVAVFVWMLVSLLKTKIKVLLVCSFSVSLLVFGFKMNHSIQEQVEAYARNKNKNVTEYVFELSTNQPNVIILFLDRAISSFFPQIINEYPKLKDIFSGFTFYPNTVSFARQTLYSAPSLLGGYEYTPLRLQKDTTHTMREKYNESVSVLPFLFKKNGYDVFINWIPFLNYEDFNQGEMFTQAGISYQGPYNKTTFVLEDVSKIKRVLFHNLFYFSLLSVAPEIVHDSIYRLYAESFLNKQDYDAKFVHLYDTKQHYDLLKNIKVHVKDTTQPSFILHYNLLAHSPAFLTKDYTIPNTPEEEVKTLPNMYMPGIVQHYQVNMASYKLIAELLLRLKKQGVYDNTKILIISDHGYDIPVPSEIDKDLIHNSALLLVKDFNQTGPIKTDKTFMTTADVPLLSVQNVIDNPSNPFSHQNINQNDKANGVDIICSPLSKWHPRHWDNVNRTNLYTPEDNIQFIHVESDGILNKKLTDFKIIDSQEKETK